MAATKRAFSSFSPFPLFDDLFPVVCSMSSALVLHRPLLLVLCTIFWECLVLSQASSLLSAPLLNLEKYLYLQQNSQDPPNPDDAGQAGRTAQPGEAAIRAQGGAGQTAVTKALLERTGRRHSPDILFQYPRFGRSDVDRDIEAWVWHLASSFENDFSSPELGRTGVLQEDYNVAWLNASYTVFRASSVCASVVFDVWMHTGSSRLSQDILTLNYNLLSGQRLNIVDIFENVDTALRILSRESRKQLLQGAGRLLQEDIEYGTLPLPENFASIALTSRGIRVYFQPYQVMRMPDAKDVEIPLETLMPAGPLLALWGRE